jgi:soluble lytic murein transglycosylase-like protein
VAVRSTEVVKPVLDKSKLIATIAAGAMVPALATQALAEPGEGERKRGAALELLEKPEQRLERSIELHERRVQRQRERERQRELASFAPPEEYGVSQATLDTIASCESGGDPTAVSPDGTYRGKYQFDMSTWASVGGSGDPAAAPEEEQDMRAAILYSRAGSSPWPICGA